MGEIFKSADALAQAAAQAMWDEDPATQKLGMQIVEVRSGYARLTMRVREDMSNGHKTCHGGFIFSLADSAFAFACNSHNQRTVAQHCSITYIAPGHLGEVLEAEAREISKTGRSGIYDIAVRNPDGVIIAQFRGHSRTIKGELVPGAVLQHD